MRPMIRPMKLNTPRDTGLLSLSETKVSAL